nr:hypothetical protein [Tanacetum cinerariifolium]
MGVFLLERIFTFPGELMAPPRVPANLNQWYPASLQSFDLPFYDFNGHRQSPSPSALARLLSLCVMHRNRPQSLRFPRTGAPHGEELGLMKPLSESLSSCFDNSFISDGAKWYGAQATGATLGIRLIWNSTGRAGGRPGKSSGNTSGSLGR